MSRAGPLPRPRRPRDPRVATLPAGRRALAAVSRPVFLAGILVDHAPAGATPLLAGIDLATGNDAAPAVARALLTALRHDGFPVLPDDYLDQYDAYTGPDGVPLYCDYAPVDSGETYWEVWAHDDRPLPEALVAGIADGWMDGWDARESLAARARDTGADVAALVDRVLALEGRAGPSAAATLARDAEGHLTALPQPLQALPVLAAFAASETGNLFLDCDDEYWNQQIGREEWRWSVSLVRRLRREWTDALAILAAVEETRRALADRSCWPRVLTSLANTLAAAIQPTP